jgi:hypothetical protein
MLIVRSQFFYSDALEIAQAIIQGLMLMVRSELKEVLNQVQDVGNGGTSEMVGRQGQILEHPFFYSDALEIAQAIIQGLMLIVRSQLKEVLNQVQDVGNGGTSEMVGRRKWWDFRNGGTSGNGGTSVSDLRMLRRNSRSQT